MEGSVVDLSKYRFGKAKDNLETARVLFGLGKLEDSINRSYYAIFHAMRSVTVLDSFDSSKHSGIISYFNLHYVKSGIFDKDTSDIINTAFKLRQKSDYQDFYLVSKEQAQTQIKKAELVISRVHPYLIKRWEAYFAENPYTGNAAKLI